MATTIIIRSGIPVNFRASLNYQLHRLIITYIIGIFPILLYAQENVSNEFLVYSNNNIVGYLYEKTELDCENCYILDTLTVFGKEVIVQTEVELQGYADGTNIFFRNLFVELEMKRNEAIIKFNSTSTGDTYWLFIRKSKSGMLYINEELLWYPSSVVKVKISEDEYDYFRGSHICRKKVHKLLRHKIVFSDFFDFGEGSTSKKCFDCPQQYSLDECIKMHVRKKKFKWIE